MCTDKACIHRILNAGVSNLCKGHILKKMACGQHNEKNRRNSKYKVPVTVILSKSTFTTQQAGRIRPAGHVLENYYLILVVLLSCCLVLECSFRLYLRHHHATFQS